MTVITPLHGSRCVCGDRAEICSSSFTAESPLYLCRLCAMALADTLCLRVLELCESKIDRQLEEFA